MGLTQLNINLGKIKRPTVKNKSMSVSEFKKRKKSAIKERTLLKEVADKKSVKKRVVSEAKAISTKASGILKKNLGKEFSKFSKSTPKKSVMSKQPRATLDLRQRPEREVLVKQHGFKAEEIGNNNFLFN